MPEKTAKSGKATLKIGIKGKKKKTRLLCFAGEKPQEIITIRK